MTLGLFFKAPPNALEDSLTSVMTLSESLHVKVLLALEVTLSSLQRARQGICTFDTMRVAGDSGFEGWSLTGIPRGQVQSLLAPVLARGVFGPSLPLPAGSRNLPLGQLKVRLMAYATALITQNQVSYTDLSLLL